MSKGNVAAGAILVEALAALMLLYIIAYLQPHPVARLPRSAYPVPAAGLFGLRDSTQTVQSSYWFESNLIDGRAPVADTDLMLSPYSTEPARLPGDGRDRYVFLGAGFIQGSGWVETWRAPNGGTFAFLHLSSITFLSSAVRGTVYLPAPGLAAPVGTASPLVDETAGVRSVYPGGATVAVTGWPTWSQYANGEPGPSDAHLCVVYDAAAALWFSHVAHRPPPRPWRPGPFPFRGWYAWHIRHHARSVSPYCGHRLCRLSVIWWHSRTARRVCKSVVGRRQWRHPRGARHGYRRQRFQGCWLIDPERRGARPHLIRAAFRR